MIKKMLSADNGQILGINKRNIRLVYPSENRQFFKMADEKSLAKQLFQSSGVPHPETVLEFKEYKDIYNLKANMDQLENTVIKPNKGRGGYGIMVLGKKGENGVYDIDGSFLSYKKIRKHISDILMGVYSTGSSDMAIVEKRLFPHTFLKDIYNRGLADFRFIYFEKQPVMAMLRIPTSRSHGKANLHQGGIGVGIDLETGKTISAIYRGKYIEKHPDTNIPLAKKPVPYLKEMLAYCSDVCKIVPLKYIGFDFTLDQKNGPMLLEINARPGLEIQKANKKGLLEVL
ncbi:MAG: hypothetical protein OEV66_03560 [Spirochaetia bacterium]|nr:hypothetical protein [Spirochaetia bacterium]